MSFGQQFLAGQRFAQGLVETYQSAKQRRALEEIADAKPQQVDEFTAEQGEKIQQAAADPTKHIGYDNGIKAYMATPKLTDGETGPAQPVEIARQTPITTFMGKKHQGTMTPDQVMGARQLAMAEVISKSDPIQGMRLQREVKQGERDDKRWERENRKATEEEDFQKGQQTEFGQTIYSKRMGDYATQVQAYEQYQARAKAGEPPETLGPPPAMPQRPAYSVGESLADGARLLAFKAAKGKADPAELMQFAERFQKVNDEGYGKALKLAQGGAPLAKVIEQFNQAGGMKLDPAAVVSDEMVKGADGVPARVIKVRDPSGNVQTINALSELDAIGQAETYFNRFDKNRTFNLKERELEDVKIRNAETRAEMASMRASIAAARGGGRGGEADAPSFNPLGNFDSKKAQAVAFEQAAAAVDAKGQPLSPQEQGKRAQEIYRSMEDAFATENTRRQRATVFRAEARNATTPEEIEAVRQRAAASGYTAEEMAALDKRFARQTNQTPAAGAGASAASERAATTPSASAPAQPEAAPAYRGGRPAVMDAMFRNSRNAQPAAAAPPEQPRSGRSPQSLGDDFASPMARQALAARVAEAAKGGAPLTKIEALRAQQLRLL